MNVVIHDLPKGQINNIFDSTKKDIQIISDNGNIKNCIECFGCWVKSRGECIIHDSYNNMGAIFSKAKHVIIISKCCYGGYSPFVKTVLDRSISYLLPFFKTIDNETHHKQRYKKSFSLSVYFYGEYISPQEKETAKKLVKANSLNFYISEYKIYFFRHPLELINEVKIL